MSASAQPNPHQACGQLGAFATATKAMTPNESHCANTDALALRSVVHEIQGHTLAIAVFSDELVHDENLDVEKLRSGLRRICQLAHETQRVVDAVGRLYDESPLERVDIDLSGLCARVFERRSNDTRHCAAVLLRVQSNIRLHGDLGHVTVLLDNLIGNALKFTSKRKSPEIRITATTEANRCVVHVSDNGVGIASEDAERIFQPFTRCHPSFSGSGVGLAIARRIVVRHGGRIWATGELGERATISFFL